MNQLRLELLEKREDARLRRKFEIRNETFEFRKKEIRELLKSEIKIVENLLHQRILKIRGETKSSLIKTREYYLKQMERENLVKLEATNLITQLKRGYYNQIQELSGLQRALLIELNSLLSSRNKQKGLTLTSNNNEDSNDDKMNENLLFLPIAWNGNDNESNDSMKSHTNSNSNSNSSTNDSSNSSDNIDEDSDSSDSNRSQSDVIESESSESEKEEQIEGSFSSSLSLNANSNECEIIESNLKVLDNACDKLLSELKLNSLKKDNIIVSKKWNELQRKLNKIAALMSSNSTKSTKEENSKVEVDSVSHEIRGTVNESSSSCLGVKNLCDGNNIDTKKCETSVPTHTLPLRSVGISSKNVSEKNEDFDLERFIKQKMNEAVSKAVSEAIKNGKKLSWSEKMKIQREIKEKYSNIDTHTQTAIIQI